MRKIDFYGPIQCELGVIMAFSKIHELLGFKKLMPSASRGFDIDSIEYNGHDVTVEFEFLSGNFIAHGHQDNMISERKYVVVCWEDDCGLSTKLKNEYGLELFDIIEMRKYVNIRNDLERIEAEKPLYVVLSYNPDNADGIDFGEWAFGNCLERRHLPKNPNLREINCRQAQKYYFIKMVILSAAVRL